MTITVPNMVRFPTTEDTSNATSGAIAAGTITGGTAVKGVVVAIAGDANAAPVTGVTYAGAALTLAGTAGDATEAGNLLIYQLVGSTSTVPDNANGTIAFTGATTANKIACAWTLTDPDADLKVSGTVAKNTQTASVFRAGTLLPTSGVHAVAFGAMHDGNAEPPSTDAGYTPVTPGGGMTYASGTSNAFGGYIDYGTRAAEIASAHNAVPNTSSNSHGGTLLIGYTTTVSEDWAMVGIVVEEVTAASFEQVHYRFRDDTSTLNSSTFTLFGTDMALDQNATVDAATVDKTIRLRLEVEEDASGTATALDFNDSTPPDKAGLQVNPNGGGWQDVWSSATVVRLADSSQFASGDSTTDVLSGSGLTFDTGKAQELTSPTGFSTNTLSNEHTELEYCFVLRSVDLVAGDILQFRVKACAGRETALPTITIGAPPPDTFMAPLTH